MGIAEVLVGFLAGFAGGLGVGGGSILLLWLTAFAGTKQLSAQGINLLFFLPCAASALFAHWKNGFIKWKTALHSLLFGIPGVFFGYFIAESIDKTLLRGAFALLLLFIGIRELLRKEE
ncbi:MAG: sulfite exporter TauE/SafE family protein [Oscillospiraceae bacterium]|nr:sulfite exporter TauE/SafE family protein [Oscillospiraceae bacterium]MBR3952037.1 sulfite exporter TauE/SafE family protein [Oscillospiraceae bacterium]